MLTIRLQRIGKHKKPIYRLVINEKHKTTKGNVLEILGHHNPHTKEFDCKNERIKHWFSLGAQCSATVNNLLIDKGVIQAKKVKAWKPKKKAKTEEKPKTENKEKTTETAEKTEEKKEEAKPEETKEETEQK